MFKKILPIFAVLLLAGCATTPMAGGTCCPKAEHKCMCTKCDCHKCEPGKCECNKGEKVDSAQSKDGKICMKKEAKTTK